MALDKINQESKFNAWRSKVKVTGNEKCKSHFFAHIFVKSWSIYVKRRPQWSTFYSAHIFRQFTSESA